MPCYAYNLYREAPDQMRSRLVRNSDLHKSWEVEYPVKEIRLLLDPHGLEAQSTQQANQSPYRLAAYIASSLW